MKKLISKALLAVILTVGLVACAPADRHFWYPVSLKYATCSTFKGEIYIMTNSRGWRSWPYILDRATKAEITLGSDCTLRSIRKLPVHKRKIQDHLTPEQKEYLVEGF